MIITNPSYKGTHFPIFMVLSYGFTVGNISLELPLNYFLYLCEILSARQRMKVIYNDSQLDYEEWSKLERNPDTIDVELRSQKRRLFREKHSTTIQFDWPQLPTIKQNTTYHPRVSNVLPLGTSFEYYPELRLTHHIDAHNDFINKSNLLKENRAYVCNSNMNL